MSLALYIHASSPLHRLAPSIKIAVLIAAGIGVFLVGNPVWLMPAAIRTPILIEGGSRCSGEEAWM